MDAISMFVILSILVASSPALLTPMKNNNGEPDVNSISNHVLLLEQMMSALTNKVSDQTRSMDTSSNDLNALKSQYVTLESKYLSLQTSVESERKLREESIRNLTSSIALLKTDVGFEVLLRNDITDQQDREPLKFNDIRYNAGGSYHNTSGIFIAPVSGSYLFWCHVMIEDDTAFYINLHHEGSIIAKGHLPMAHNYLTASITSVVHVNKGDNLWFSKDSGTQKLNGGGYSSFGGVLLHLK